MARDSLRPVRRARIRRQCLHAASKSQCPLADHRGHATLADCGRLFAFGVRRGVGSGDRRPPRPLSAGSPVAVGGDHRNALRGGRPVPAVDRCATAVARRAAAIAHRDAEHILRASVRPVQRVVLCGLLRAARDACALHLHEALLPGMGGGPALAAAGLSICLGSGAVVRRRLLFRHCIRRPRPAPVRPLRRRAARPGLRD